MAIQKLCHDICSHPREDHSRFSPYPHYLCEATVAGWQLSVDIPPAWGMLTWWHQAGSESGPPVGVVLLGQWQAWELYAATPYTRQTLKGKVN